MKRYFRVGNREQCGHRHRTYSGARRCAGWWLNSPEMRESIRADADDRGPTVGGAYRREYREWVEGLISEITDRSA